MPSASTKHVFMSYSRRDQAVMERVLKFLRKQGIKVWLDNEKLIPGTPIWEKEIERAIKTAVAVVVICSPDSNESEWVRREITFAERYHKRIFPLLASGDEDTSISIRLSTCQYVDIRENEETGLKSVSTAITLYLEEIDRREKEEQEKKAAEVRARVEVEEKSKKEKEEREAEEKKRAEKREQEERARIAAAQQTQKERKERERKEAEEKTRKAALRKAHLQEVVERIKNIFSGGNRLPFYIGGGVVILFFLGYIVKSALSPSLPAPPTETFATTTLPSATSTEMPSAPRLTSTEPPTEIPFTPTPTSTDLPTEIPPTPTQMFDIGDTMVSEKDGMVMVYVPAGEFEMGSENGDNNEKPVHNVYLDAFWIDQTEVTNAMYAKCVEIGECAPPNFKKSKTRNQYYGNSEFDDYPVIYISWNDAIAYCEWAGRHLPSEAEWEKAASWDDKNRKKNIYPWGDSIDCSRANYGSCEDDTTAVGSYESGQSPYGAYDMAGNAWEWVADWYDVYPGGDKSVSKYFGHTYRVLRGGAWSSVEDVLRTSYRNFLDPSSFNSLNFGFRCSFTR